MTSQKPRMADAFKLPMHVEGDGDVVDSAGEYVAEELQPEAAEALALAVNSHDKMREALEDLRSFVAIMVGRGADAVIPETIQSPLGPKIKIGAIMRNANAALAEGR